jgi:hypothetical protein
VRIYIALKEDLNEAQIYDSFESLLKESEMSIFEKQRILNAFMMNDPRVIAVWNTYLVRKDFTDAMESLEVMCTLSDFLFKAETQHTSQTLNRDEVFSQSTS